MERFTICKEEGKRCLLAKEFDDSIRYYAEADRVLSGIDLQSVEEGKLNVNTERAILNTNIGVGYFSLLKFDAALHHFKEAQQLNPAYEKAFYRAAQCLEKTGEYGDALLHISKIVSQCKDQDVLALHKRLMDEVSKDQQSKVIVPKLVGHLQASNIHDVTIVDKDKGTTVKQRMYKNEKEIEYDLVMLSKGLEKGTNLADSIYILTELSKMLTQHNIDEWKSLISYSILMRYLGTLLQVIESVQARDLEKVYLAFNHDENMHQEITKLHKYLWVNYASHNGKKEVKELLAKFPGYLCDIGLWNSVSILFKVGSDQMDNEDVDFFLAIIFNRTSAIRDSNSEILRKLEKVNIEEMSSIFAEFVERISRVNTKNCKSFLVTFFKCIKNICGFEIYKMLFHNISHLYRDNFSFQSILLMNSVILSDYPSNLEEFIKNEPLFLNSIVTLTEHLNFLIQSDDFSDPVTLFKLENSFQLLYLCLSNKKFLGEINTASVNLNKQAPFRDALKKFLETSYTVHLDYPPNICAKSLVCTAVVILELFPVLFH